MSGRFYRVVRDLHLYLGLFISPFVLVFAISVFFLVHSWLPGIGSVTSTKRVVSISPLPEGLRTLSGRPLIEALKPVLERAGVRGEVGFVRHLVKEEKLIIPVTIPGRETTVSIRLGNADATVYLILFISVSGIYLWYVLRAERATGLILLCAGALSFFGMAYALIH